LCGVVVPRVVFLTPGKIGGIFEWILQTINMIANLPVDGSANLRVRQNYFVGTVEHPMDPMRNRLSSSGWFSLLNNQLLISLPFHEGGGVVKGDEFAYRHPSQSEE
jgi:hypothetical protein